jgi:prepilin-type N-terminal cleavage/methylation domain-containing protein
MAKKLLTTGFSLLEVMVVIAIFIILFSSVATLTSDKTIREDLDAQAQATVDILSRAHSYAVTSYYGDHWGIKLLNNSADCDVTEIDCIILFKGTSYDTRNDEYDQKLLFNTGVYFDEQVNNEFYFQKSSGWLFDDGSPLAEKALILQTNLGSQKIVTSTPAGLIYYGD